MGTNPYTAGVFYTGSFITEEFVQTFSDLDIDKRVAVLATISARPEVSQIIMQYSFTTSEDPTTLASIFHYHYVNTNGDLVGQDTPPQFVNKTDTYLNMHRPPAYLIFTDETLGYKYVVSNPTTATWTASSTPPAFSPDYGQFVGDRMEFVGEDGQSVYMVRVDSNDAIHVELDRVEPERIATLRVSNGHPFAYDGVNFWIEGLISIDDISYTLEESEAGFGGISIPRTGTVSIQLADQSFEYLVEQSWDSRDIEISVGLTSEPIAEYDVVLRGKTERAEANLDILSVTLRDQSILMDRSIQNRAYRGIGGYEGTEDVIGVLRPICYGFCRHVTPRLFNESLHMYQIHDGPIHEIFSVHTGGVLLTNIGGIPPAQTIQRLDGWIPSQAQVDAGGFMTHYDYGMFRLAAPPVAPLTVVFWGDRSVPQGTNNLSDIIRGLLARRVPEATLDANSFDAYSVDQVGAAGIYIDEDVTVNDVMKQLVEPLGGILIMDGLNRVKVKQLRANVPKAFFSDNNIVDDLPVARRQPKKAGNVYRVGYGKAWTMLQESDFLGATSVNIKIFMASEYRYIRMELYGPGINRLPVYESARMITHDSMLDSPAAAKKAAVLLATRDHSLQNIYEVTVVGYGFQLELGDTVLLQFPRLRVNAVKTALVVGITEKAITGAQEDFTRFILWA